MDRLNSVSSSETIEKTTKLTSKNRRKIAGIVGSGIAVFSVSACSATAAPKATRPTTSISTTSSPNSIPRSTVTQPTSPQETTTTSTVNPTTTSTISPASINQIPNLAEAWPPTGYQGWVLNAEGECVATSSQVEDQQSLPAGCEQADHVGITAVDLDQIDFNQTDSTSEDAWVVSDAGNCLDTANNNNGQIPEPAGCDTDVQLTRGDLPTAAQAANQPSYVGWVIDGTPGPEGPCDPLSSIDVEIYMPAGCEYSS